MILARDEGIHLVWNGLETTEVFLEFIVVQERADVLFEAFWVQLDRIRLLIAELVDDLLAVCFHEGFEGLLPNTARFSEVKRRDLHKS